MQKQVIEKTGYPFQPIKALQIIKDDSKDYSIEDEEALKADSRLMDWLHQNGFSINNSETKVRFMRPCFAVSNLSA